MKQLCYVLPFLLSMNGCTQTNDQIVEWRKIMLNDTNLHAEEYSDSLIKYDLGLLWTETDNSFVYGFIGDNFQRIRIKITSTVKDKETPAIYLVIGKSMVKDNICQFQGTIKIITARVYKEMHFGVDNEYLSQKIRNQGVLMAEYSFKENPDQPHSGIFEGMLSTLWYIDKNGQVKYDDIEKESDNYRNNQFVGTWTGYDSRTRKICNWGDYRIPFSKDIDIGAGFFSPSDKYLQNGWQNLYNAIYNDKEAVQREYIDWWNPK